MAAVLSHEAAHIEGRHQRFLVLAAAVERALGFVPGVKRSTASLRAGLERWADEASTAGDAGRRTALRDALRSVTRTLVAPVPAFSHADALVERLDALDGPPVPLPLALGAVLYAPGVALVVAAVGAVAAWSCQSGVLEALTGFCPLRALRLG